MAFPRRHFPRRYGLIVPALCLLHVWMAASVSRQFSTTADEIVHITAGYTYWTHGDYRLQPENGNFPQRWEALPLLFLPLNPPSTELPGWKEGNAWMVGDAFFHHSGNDVATILAAARAMTALLSGLLCFAIFHIGSDCLGRRAGFLAGVLAIFSPSLLAHGGLATSDTAAALGFLLASWTWWRLLQRVTLVRIAGAGAALGLLAVSKFSVVLMGPILLGTAMLRLCRPAALPVMIGSFRRKYVATQRLLVVIALLTATTAIAGAMIWAAYGFRFAASVGTPKDAAPFVQSWDTVLFKQPSRPPMMMADGRPEEDTDRKPRLVQRAVTWLRHQRLLPEAYLYGLAFVEKNSRGRLAFFAGEYRMTGWRSYFPTVFVLKTTLPALALIGLGILGLCRLPAARRRVFCYRLSPLLLLLAVYWLFAVNSRLNIGHRHLLPTYPACYMIAGAAVFLLRLHRGIFVVLFALGGCHVIASVATRPDYLAYFNVFAGGPRQAYRLVVDSSLDWGQDLPRLKTWIDARSTREPIFLSYFGSGSPEYEGITATRFGDAYFDGGARAMPARLSGGVYCISATMFQRVYTQVRGPWSAGYERAYQESLLWLGELTRERALPENVRPRRAESEVSERLFTHEQLQFGRLCYFLRNRPPDVRIGYSILVFNLTNAEVAFALYAPLADVRAALTNQPVAQSRR